MSTVAVVSGDSLPYPGFSTSGGGLRAWNLGEGLRARGHRVRYLMPAACVSDRPRPDDPDLLLYETWDEGDLARKIAQARPDAVVTQHWRAVAPIAHLDVPLAVDLHGPLLLERAYLRSDEVLNERSVEKIKALQRADFFTCAGEIQKKYFLAWLLLAGVDIRNEAIFPIPVSVSPDLPEHAWPEAEPNFVFGGQFLPWQDPSTALLALVEEMEDAKRGRLDFFGGVNPVFPGSSGVYAELEPKLARSAHVRVHGRVSRDALIGHYRRSHAALDVMARNYERELAFTTRTVEYLWCGLPVVYADYGELAGHIREYEAGWIVPADDREAIRRTLRAILADPEDARRRSRNAQRLVRERLTWDRTIAPLDAFCRHPERRPRAAASIVDVLSGPKASAPARPRYPRLRRLLVRTGLAGLYRKLPAGVRLRLRGAFGRDRNG